MAKLSIAQLREKELYKLADIIAAVNTKNEVYTDNLKIAQNLMNRYYRLCGADERLLYLENDERTANRRSTQELSEQTEKRLAKLQADFKAYGLKLVYFGYMPTICYIDSTQTAVERYFYN